jgi:hypothetical protein
MKCYLLVIHERTKTVLNTVRELAAQLLVKACALLAGPLRGVALKGENYVRNPRNSNSDFGVKTSKTFDTKWLGINEFSNSRDIRSVIFQNMHDQALK